MNAAAPTKVGNTKGSGSTTRHSRASGTSVRVVNHARAVPSASAAPDTDTASRSERHSGPSVRPLMISPAGSAPSAKLRYTRYTPGNANPSASIRPSARSSGGAAGGRRGPGLSAVGVLGTLTCRGCRRLGPLRRSLVEDAAGLDDGEALGETAAEGVEIDRADL